MAGPNARWMWIELIGFENTAPDLGVGRFLGNAGFVPEGLSLLIATADFVHTHEGLEREVVLPPDYCSYGAKPYNSERARQQWTNRQLAGLVAGLRERGVRAYFTLFNLYVCELDGQLYRSPWCASHPELSEFTRDGEPAMCLSPIKRLADGRYYDDLLAEAAVRVARDYGFDGVHVADGYSSPRLPLWKADYSDDVVGQFVEATGVSLPWEVAPEPGFAPTAERIRGRADWIWRHHRREWQEFYADRFAGMHRKLCDAMHAVGREVVANSTWTRDPFEAYERWGLDYRRLARAGVDRFVMETVGAGVSIGAESGVRVDPRSEYNLMLALTKARLPEVPLLCLNGTGDVTENWDVLSHAPAVSEREIHALGSTFLHTASGLARASEGPVVCLADGIESAQWAWLRRCWDAAYAPQPARVLGATVLTSDAALEAEWGEYATRRTLSRQRIASELQRLGAPVQSVIDVASLPSLSGCLLVPRPELLPPEQLAAAFAHTGPVVTIGRQDADLPPADLCFGDGVGPERLECRVYGAAGLAAPALDRPPATPPRPSALPEPHSFLEDLWFEPVSEGFLRACAEMLIALTDVPRVVSDSPDLRVLAYEATDGTIRLLVGNEVHFYTVGQVRMPRPVASVRVASHFPGRPVPFSGRDLTVRVPPRGLTALDVGLVAE